jgi:hypothetical protein
LSDALGALGTSPVAVAAAATALLPSIHRYGPSPLPCCASQRSAPASALNRACQRRSSRSAEPRAHAIPVADTQHLDYVLPLRDACSVERLVVEQQCVA